MERALSFGADARAYDRHRPGYPDELVDLVLAHAEGPVRTALEVGAGTGKATVVFASRGIDVVAVEPDAAMGAVLSEQVRGLPGQVSVLEGTFEDVDAADVAVDLVFAAAAFHWTDPMSAADHVAHLATISAFGVLPRDRRDAVLGSVRSALPPQVEVTEDVVLHLARRTHVPSPRSTP